MSGLAQVRWPHRPGDLVRFARHLAVFTMFFAVMTACAGMTAIAVHLMALP